MTDINGVCTLKNKACQPDFHCVNWPKVFLAGMYFVCMQVNTKITTAPWFEPNIPLMRANDTDHYTAISIRLVLHIHDSNSLAVYLQVSCYVRFRSVDIILLCRHALCCTFANISTSWNPSPWSKQCIRPIPALDSD